MLLLIFNIRRLIFIFLIFVLIIGLTTNGNSLKTFSKIFDTICWGVSVNFGIHLTRIWILYPNILKTIVTAILCRRRLEWSVFFQHSFQEIQITVRAGRRLAPSAKTDGSLTKRTSIFGRMNLLIRYNCNWFIKGQIINTKSLSIINLNPFISCGWWEFPRDSFKSHIFINHTYEIMSY